MTREKLLDGLAESAKSHQVMKVEATIRCHDCCDMVHGIGDTDYDAAVTAASVAADKGWKFKEKTGGVFCRKCWPKFK